MEKVKKRYSKQYPMLRLFKNDLEKIISLFENDYKDADIVVDEYKLTNISEIDKITKSKTSDFSIEAFQRYPQEIPYRSVLFNIQLTGSGAQLSISDENDTPYGGPICQDNLRPKIR